MAQGWTCSFSFQDILGSETPIVDVVDVGAMSLGEGTEAYAPLLKGGLCKVVGFEPVEEECDKMNAIHSAAGHRFLPYFIGTGQRAVFHLCNFPMTSSLYEPNEELLNKYQNLAELTQVVKKTDVATTRLDDTGLGNVDFIKLDVQGAELDVINGGHKTMKNVVVVETEVEFVPMYKGQPLFAEVDQALRGLGFNFHRFKGLCGRTMKPLVVNGDVNSMGSQVLWGDAIYVRDPCNMSRDKLLRQCLVLHDVYSSFDLVHSLLERVDAIQTTPPSPPIAPVYLARIKGSEPTPPTQFRDPVESSEADKVEEPSPEGDQAPGSPAKAQSPPVSLTAINLTSTSVAAATNPAG